MAVDAQALIMQMLAARAGLPAETTQQELLSQLGGSDPRLNMLMQYLAQRGEAEAEPAEEDTEVYSEDEVEMIPPAGAGGRWRAASEEQEVVQQMAAEIEQLRGHCDALAAALGACYLCWGTDAACGHCLGKGRPGAALPDARLFRQLVVPAVARWQQHRKAAGAQPPRRRPGGSTTNK